MVSTLGLVPNQGLEIDLGNLTATDIDFHLTTEDGVPNEKQILNRSQQIIQTMFSQL